MSDGVLGLKRIGLCLLLLLVFAFPAAARADDAAVQTTWRLLDYVAVDYPGAVPDGRIVSQLEYDEMREFSRLGDVERLGALPDRTRRGPAWSPTARELEAAIARKAPPAEVDRRARALAGQLLAALSGAAGARRRARISRAAPRLYAENCAVLPRRRPAAPTRRWRAAWIRRRSPSPTGRGRASAACSPSIR